MTDEKSCFCPDRVLTELRKSFQNRSVVDVEEIQIKVVVLAAGNQRYVLHGKDVKEILAVREIHPLPFLPPYLPGLIHVRGEIEAVIDLGLFLGNGKAQGSSGVIVMVQKGKFRAGIMVDAVVDVVDIAADSVRPPLSSLSGVLREVVSGTVAFSGKALVLLDVEKLAARLTP